MIERLATLLLIALVGCSRSDVLLVPFPLPEDGAQVGICAAVRPPEIQRLTERFGVAVAQQQEWMKAYVAEVRPRLVAGTPLPYNERFGLTSTEYAEMIEGVKKTSYEPVDAESVTVTSDADTIRLHFGPKLAVLNDIVVSRATLWVTTPLGKASPPRQETVTESRLGAWTGYSWSYSDGESGAGERCEYSLDIGTTTQGVCFLYYLAHAMTNGVMQMSVECLLKFDGHTKGSQTTAGSAR